jgi:hypothetical protein
MRRLLFVGMVCLAGVATGAAGWQLDAPASKLTVHGTSSLHDWTMEAQQISLEVIADSPQEPGKSGQAAEDSRILGRIRVEVPVASLTSDNSLMDDKAHNALRRKEHPLIVFTSVNIGELTAKSSTLKGRLTLAGVTKPLEISLTEVEAAANRLSFDGQVSIDMTEYQIEPPSVLLVSVGDSVQIKFNIELMLASD